MTTFNDTLVAYLKDYGTLVRHGEQEPRSVQYELNELAKLVESQDTEALTERLEYLKEDLDLLY